MREHINIIQEFLTRGAMRLARFDTIYQILSIDEQGEAQVILDPNARRFHTSITLTEQEQESLASLCFPPKPIAPVEPPTS